MDNVQYEVRYIVFETLYWSVFENLYYKSETGETKHMIKIAIVEDEAMYAKQLQDFLRQYETENGEAFDITIYSDGDQIVHKYKSQFDIILMDVEMKFMDGMSAAEEIGSSYYFYHKYGTVCDSWLCSRCIGLCA